jgi:hypothetical protein
LASPWLERVYLRSRSGLESGSYNSNPRSTQYLHAAPFTQIYDQNFAEEYISRDDHCLFCNHVLPHKAGAHFAQRGAHGVAGLCRQNTALKDKLMCKRKIGRKERGEDRKVERYGIERDFASFMALSLRGRQPCHWFPLRPSLIKHIVLIPLERLHSRA